jgi:hypothetical protein
MRPGGGGRIGREAAEHDPPDAGRAGDLRGRGADGDARSARGRKPVDAGRDRGERDRVQAMLGGQGERGAIAGGEQCLFAQVAAAPDRSDRMDDVPGLEAVAAGDLGGAGVAAAQGLALGQQLRAGGAVDGAIDAAAAEQRAVRCIHDGVDVECRDVGDADLEP